MALINIISLPGSNQIKALESIKPVKNADINLFILLQDGQMLPQVQGLSEYISNKIKTSVISAGKSSHEIINENFLGKSLVEEEYLFFLSPDVILSDTCLSNLLKEIQSSPELSGVNPVLTAGWIEGERKYIAHMGTVADYQKKFHFLYEGINFDNPLVSQKRFFQFAFEGALLIRLRDFKKSGGFQTRLEYLAFPSLCISINNLGYKGFSSISACTASLVNRFESWEVCGMWNSLLLRGKLDASGVQPDYPCIVIKDGLDYNTDLWLNEYVDLKIDQNVWTDWRHHPQPVSLLKYISALPEKFKFYGVELCRNLPASLPQVFEYYIVQNKKISEQAQRHENWNLEKQCIDWDKRKTRFHHGILKPGMKLLQNAGIYNCSLDTSPAIFDAWVELAEKFEKIEPGLEYPEIAVLMPVWNPDPGFLIEAIESVLKQDYPKWQFCIADDASDNPEIREIITRYGQKDPRFKIRFRKENGHICKASNTALEMITAPYTAFFDHDDLLAPEALGLNAQTIALNSGLGYIYSDEDHIDINNIRRSPVFRPDFDGELFFAGHLSVYSTELLNRLGGLREGTEGSQDQDLQRRVSQLIEVNKIYHIPHILYHWRVHEKSTAGSLEAKPYVLDATRKVLLDDASRKGFRAEVFESIKKNVFQLYYLNSEPVDCSIIIYSESATNNSNKIELYKSENNINYEVIQLSPSRDWIEKCNYASEKAQGEIIVFIRHDIQALPDCHLDQLVLMARRDDLAMVGGLIWKNNVLYNGGWYPDINAYPFPLLRGCSRMEIPKMAFSHFILPRNVLGVPRECMVIKKEILKEGYFLNPDYGELCTVDFALRQMEKGRNCLVSPWGQFNLRTENIPPLPEKQHYELLKKKWGGEIINSGLRNKNLKAAPDLDWTLIL